MSEVQQRFNRDGKARGWCFTLHDYTVDHENALKELDCKYLVYGREKCPTTGRPHLQGYVYFVHPRWFDGVRTILPTAHWEKAKGDAESNRTYCTKDGDYVETGLIPMSQKRKGEVEQERWKRALVLARDNKLEDIDADIQFRYYNTCKAIARDYMKKSRDLTALENIWVFGPPGVGKSRQMRRDYPGAYFKPGNKWWDGYQGEENVIIDDFELDWKCLGHYVKIWADRYSFIAEYKGGSMNIRPKRILITSNYSIEEVFAADQTMVAAINRRFTQRYVGLPIVFEPTPPPSPVGLERDEVLEAVAEAAGVIDDDAISVDLDDSLWDDVNADLIP